MPSRIKAASLLATPSPALVLGARARARSFCNIHQFSAAWACCDSIIEKSWPRICTVTSIFASAARRLLSNHSYKAATPATTHCAKFRVEGPQTALARCIVYWCRDNSTVNSVSRVQERACVCEDLARWKNCLALSRESRSNLRSDTEHRSTWTSLGG